MSKRFSKSIISSAALAGLAVWRHETGGRRSKAAPLGEFLYGAALAALTTVVTASVGTPVSADETCQSPYMAKITGEEEFVYV